MSAKYRLSSGLILFASFISICISSCKKFIEVSPPDTAISGSNVYSTDATAAAVFTGLYTTMSSGSFAAGISSISVQSGLSADELTLYGGSNPALTSLYENALNSRTAPGFWQSLYSILYSVNSGIEGLGNSNSLTPSVKEQLFGEAKFMRAFCNFYLVTLYGDIPLVLSSDYQINAVLARTPAQLIYEQIITDLLEAKSSLKDYYVAADGQTQTSERVRPNKWTATALLARAYLFKGDWTNAEAQATELINNTTMYILENNLDAVFLRNSTEAIWQLQPVNAGVNTEDARLFVLKSGPDLYNYPVYISSFLKDAFEANDNRLTKWIGIDSSTGTKYSYPYKYKKSDYGDPVTEYLMVFRIAEQYLIRAEASVQGGSRGLSGGTDDLNLIRARAGLPPTTATSKDDLLTAILHERQVELFTEWGQRWLDLRRSGKVNDVMSFVTPQKGGSWNSNWQLYPIPLADIQADPNLTQNPGY